MKGFLRYTLVIAFTLIPFLQSAIAEPAQEGEQIFELAPKETSKTYVRPADADYFWWDTAAEVEVELKFADGTRVRAPSEKSFSKKIIEVTFVNPTKLTQKVALRTGL